MHDLGVLDPEVREELAIGAQPRLQVCLALRGRGVDGCDRGTAATGGLRVIGEGSGRHRRMEGGTRGRQVGGLYDRDVKPGGIGQQLHQHGVLLPQSSADDDLVDRQTLGAEVLDDDLLPEGRSFQQGEVDVMGTRVERHAQEKPAE